MSDINSVLTLCLLNIRSLKKHSSDIKKYVNLFETDILALTKTQLLPGDSDMDIANNLIPFTLYRYDHNSYKLSSLAICIKVSATLKIAIFPYLRFQRFQIGMLESFLLKKNQKKILFLSKDIGGKRFFLVNYLY